MNKPSDKLIKIYDRLLNYVLTGSSALVVLRTIRKEYEDHPNKGNDLFITTLIFSTYNTVILALANTIKEQDDSIHIQYLVNHIKNSKKLFDLETYNRFKVFADELEFALSTISETTKRIIELRDTSIAHLDRKHINNPSFLLQKPPVAWKDLEIAYTVIGRGLLEIGTYLGFDNNIQDYIDVANFELMKKTLQVLALFDK